MKKLLLVVGIAFGCTTVYGQTVINQTGDHNVLMGSKPGVTNPATQYFVSQLGGYNTIIITQGADVNSPGQENIATLRQSSIGAVNNSLRNIFDVMQSGGNNRINGDQYGRNNRATLEQGVITNSSKITTSQSGYNNGIVVRQLSGTYTANIQQGEAIPAGAFANPPVVGGLPSTRFNSAELIQEGFRGIAQVEQLGASALFYGNQKGGDNSQNVILVRQNNNAGAFVWQSGDNNLTNIQQQGFQAAGVFQRSLDVNNDLEPVNSQVNILQGVDRLDDTRNQAIVRQLTGDGNQVNINQNTTGAAKNNALVTQMGTRSGLIASTVTVNQMGKSGEVFFQQTRLSTGNTATINQDGIQEGKGNWVHANQGGSQNVFTTDQVGNLNRVIGSGGMAFEKFRVDPVTKMLVKLGDSNDQATQMGENNTATLGQRGQNNEISLNQDGASNTIAASQINDLASTKGNKAILTQGAGTFTNTITLNQLPPTDGDGNLATITQTEGDFNQATVDQYEGNTATVLQSGTDDGSSGGGGTQASTVNIDQSNSTDGVASATQAAGTKGGGINITQEKIGNTATVNQTKGRRNTTDILQLDDGNTADVTQSGTIDVISGGGNPSTVNIGQSGKNSIATVTQGAQGSTIAIVQDNGNANEATVSQPFTISDRQNEIFTFQFGDQNKLTSTQTGQENDAQILQSNIITGGIAAGNGPSKHVATLVQGGTLNDAVIAQGGLGNTSTLTQTIGEENFASTLQYGSDNVATVNQTTNGRLNNVNVLQATVTPAVRAALNALLATRDANNVGTNLLVFGLGGAPGADQAEDNKATVNQTIGENQTVRLFQTGDMETAVINQTGSDNTTIALQGGEKDVLNADQGGSFNSIDSRQFGAETTKGNQATITQAGDNNAINLRQLKFGNVATIDQKGNNNGPAAAAGITLTQIGERNTSTINQDAMRGNIVVVQGDAAGVNFNATSNAGTGATPFNDAFDNKSTVGQMGLDNLIAIAQQGDKGTANATQAGNDNTIGISQLNPAGPPINRSTDNMATATQTVGVSNGTINIQQEGRKNMATAGQSGNAANGSIVLVQSKDENTANLTQNTGDRNLIQVIQAPDVYGRKGGTATISQTGGSDNKALLNQSGYENTLTLTQNGDRNVLQNGGPLAPALQAGHNNTATLSQTGQDHTINLTQGAGNGFLNTATITQANL